VRLLDLEVLHQVHLGVADDPDDLAVLGDLVELLLVLLGASLGGEVLVVLVERLLLGLHEVLVEPTLAGLGHRATEDGGELAKAPGGLHVADDADDNHRRGLDDGDRVDDLLLVDLRASPVDLTDNVGHASLVPLEGGKVDGRRRVGVPRPRPDLAGRVRAPLPRQETEGSVPRVRKLAVGHDGR